MALLNLVKTEDGTLPKRVPVLPAGALIKGEDGRAWSAKDRPSVLARLNQTGRKLVLDENHSLIRSAPKGGPSPAHALLSNFQVDAEGVTWAETVEWTPYGEANARSYVGVSPVLKHRAQRAIIGDTDVLGDITDLHSVSLVNDPNLELPALNDKELAEETPSMTPEQLAAALAPFTQALTAIQADIVALKAVKETAAPVIAPNSSEATDKVKLELAVNSCLEKHVSAGKIRNDDASRAYFKTVAVSTETLAAVDAHYTAQAPLVSSDSISANSHNGNSGKSFSTEATKLMRDMGWDTAKLYPEAK